MLNTEKLKRKEFDPSAKGKGTAGVLPYIADIDSALVTLDDAVWGKMQYDYQHGREKGQTTNNKHLDRYFKWMPGYTSAITGWPGHGKSQLFFELLLLRAVFDSKKSVIWPSENLPAHRFYDGLIHTLTGRPTDRVFANALSLTEYERAKNFIKEYFILLDPPTGMPYTPAHLLAYFEAAIAKHGGAQDKHGVAHCMIDPWNKADHSAMPKMGGIEPYLIHTLGLCTKWSQDTRQCLVIAVHPKRADENMGYGKTRPVPTGGMISGGQTWENMAHYVGATHRPFDFIEGSTQAAFYSLKSKDERNVAKRGVIGGSGLDGAPPMVPINWDEISNRYRWGHEKYSPLDSPEVAKLWGPAPAAPTAELFKAAPPIAQPLRTSTPSEFEGRDEATAERFGPRQITSADLP